MPELHGLVDIDNGLNHLISDAHLALFELKLDHFVYRVSIGQLGRFDLWEYIHADVLENFYVLEEQLGHTTIDDRFEQQKLVKKLLIPFDFEARAP